jgi:glyoxylase-like metal-dependent hydrolase (beta-lactamase superfamily II)
MRKVIGEYSLGGVTLRVVSGGALKLDGGAMFGIIPKALWSRSTPADEQNRIQLACNCVLVEWEGQAGRRAVIETGHGAKYSPKEQAMFAIDPSHELADSLRAIGVDPGERGGVSDVVLTHLHFDHAGGLTQALDPEKPDGPARPTFAGARVHVQKQEFDDARANFGIMTATYREENYRAIDEADAWRLHDGEGEILPMIHAWRTTGHTRGHQSILIAGRDRHAIFAGDVIPTKRHAGAPYNMGYDLLPLDNRESKRRVLQYLAERDGLLILDHEPETPVMRVVAEKGWYRLEPVASGA